MQGGCTARQTADAFPDAWLSGHLGQVGTAGVKVLRTDELPVAEEAHPTTEALLVLNGRLELELAGRTMSLTAHDLCLVAANTPHPVLPDSAGTLLLVDGDDEHDEGRAAAPQLAGRTED